MRCKTKALTTCGFYRSLKNSPYSRSVRFGILAKSEIEFLPKLPLCFVIEKLYFSLLNGHLKSFTPPLKHKLPSVVTPITNLMNLMEQFV